MAAEVDEVLVAAPQELAAVAAGALAGGMGAKQLLLERLVTQEDPGEILQVMKNLNNAEHFAFYAKCAASVQYFRKSKLAFFY